MVMILFLRRSLLWDLWWIGEINLRRYPGAAAASIRHLRVGVWGCLFLGVRVCVYASVYLHQGWGKFLFVTLPLPSRNKCSSPNLTLYLIDQTRNAYCLNCHIQKRPYKSKLCLYFLHPDFSISTPLYLWCLNCSTRWNFIQGSLMLASQGHFKKFISQILLPWRGFPRQ